MKKYKVVKNNKYNEDQYLIGFFETSDEAYDALPVIRKRHSEWITDIRDLHVKMVDPEFIHEPVATDYAHYIRSLIPDEDWKRIMDSDAAAEIDSNDNVCGYGGRNYYYLSRMIPLDWTVVDIGCGYNLQSALFSNHKRYIAVNPDEYEKDQDWHFEHYVAPGTEYYDSTGQEFIRSVLPKLGLDMNKTFAICHWVPSEECRKMVGETFKNLFVIYPA